VIGGGKPCFLIASGGSFVLDSADLTNAEAAFSLPKPSAKLGTTIPFATAAVSATALAAYKALTGYKAMAIGLDGTVAWRDGTSRPQSRG
jgi:hypothetical protein